MSDKDCNCGAQDRAEHRPHKSDCAVYAKRRWHGFVTEVHHGEITIDMKREGAPHESIFGEVSIDRVALEDRPLLAEGAPFSWTEGDTMLRFSHETFGDQSQAQQSGAEQFQSLVKGERIE